MSRFDKQKQTKPKHLVDACIIFDAGVIPLSNVDLTYIIGGRASYNCYITHPLLGELIFASSQKIAQQEIREKLYKFVDSLLTEQKLLCLHITPERDKHIEQLKGIDHSMSNSDASHISQAIAQDFTYFITKDKFTDTTKKRILSEFRLHIKTPLEILTELGLL